LGSLRQTWRSPTNWRTIPFHRQIVSQLRTLTGSSQRFRGERCQYGLVEEALMRTRTAHQVGAWILHEGSRIRDRACSFADPTRCFDDIRERFCSGCPKFSSIVQMSAVERPRDGSVRPAHQSCATARSISFCFFWIARRKSVSLRDSFRLIACLLRRRPIVRAERPSQSHSFRDLGRVENCLPTGS
jgi:hypothetical protein